MFEEQLTIDDCQRGTHQYISILPKIISRDSGIIPINILHHALNSAYSSSFSSLIDSLMVLAHSVAM